MSEQNEVVFGVEDAKKVLQEKDKADVEGCQADLTAVFKKWSCGLQVIQTSVDGQPQRPQIVVTKVVEQGK